MTNEEKIKAIIERVNLKYQSLSAEMIPVMVIISYIDKLSKKKVIDTTFDTTFEITESGEFVSTICEEFDWKPSDSDIVDFVVAMVEESEREIFAVLIQRYRDDRDGLFQDIENSKKP